MNIILTGFMGTGKTAVGKRLAKRLGWTFVDVDALIETGARRSIAQIFSERGEAVFRRLERRSINRLVRHDQHVIATGGGAFVDPQSRSKLRASGTVICLTARPQTILDRVGRRLASRPLLKDTTAPLSRIRTLLAQRAAAYAKADITLDTSDLSPDEIVVRLWEQLNPCLCKSWHYFLTHARELSGRYGGQYVVVVEDRIVGSGDTQLEAYRHAEPRLAGTHEPGIYYIPLPEESLTAL